LNRHYRTFHPPAAEYTCFSSAQETLSKIDHTLGHKSGLNLYKKTEIISCIFSDHSAMKFEVNHKKKFGRTTNTWRLKNILLMNEWINWEVKDEIKKNTWKQMKMKTQQSKTFGNTAKEVLRGPEQYRPFSRSKKSLKYTT